MRIHKYPRNRDFTKLFLNLQAAAQLSSDDDIKCNTKITITVQVPVTYTDVGLSKYRIRRYRSCLFVILTLFLLTQNYQE
jgi:hypothetical protein